MKHKVEIAYGTVSPENSQKILAEWLDHARLSEGLITVVCWPQDEYKGETFFISPDTPQDREIAEVIRAAVQSYFDSKDIE